MTTDHRHTSGPDRGDHPTGRRRKAVPATCQLDRGPVDVTNLVVSVTRDGTIVLDPQVPDSCVTLLDEEGATTLCYLLTEWLG